MSPLSLPVICAFLMMTAALVLSGKFAEREVGRCCGSADVKLPEPPQNRVPKLNDLKPDIYARRINYVAAAELQIVAIGAAFGFGAALLFPVLRHREQRWRLAFMIIVVSLGAVSATTLIDVKTSPTLHSLIQATITHELGSIETVRIGFERTTSVILRSRLRRYATEVDLTSPPTWFDKEWLAISPFQELSKVIAIIAPFLIGQASDITSLLK